MSNWKNVDLAPVRKTESEKFGYVTAPQGMVVVVNNVVRVERTVRVRLTDRVIFRPVAVSKETR